MAPGAVMLRLGMRVLAADDDGNDVQDAVPDAALGLQLIGEAADLLDRTLEHDSFQTVIMVQVDMRGSEDKLVVLVLHGRQARSETALVVIVGIGKIGDAVSILLFEATGVHDLSQDVAYGL